MSKLLIKSAGTWTYPESVYVKQNDRWKSAREVWVKEGDEWKISWPNNTGTIEYTEATFGVFPVPDGVYNIEVYWPTNSTYISSATLAVTPGSQISYQIGEPGETSNFGGITTTKFNRQVAKFSGLVDHTLSQRFQVATTSSSSYSNFTATEGLYHSELSVAALAAGINYDLTEQPRNRGDAYTGTISLTPVMTSELLPTSELVLVFEEVNFAGGGTSNIGQQPSQGNGYTTIINTYDPGSNPNESLHFYTLRLKQQTPISIKWGDWSEILPISVPFITLISPNTGITAGGTPITITGTGFTGATGATLDGASITSFSVVSDTTITGVTPTGSLGSASIVVTRPGSTGSANGLFTYI